MDHFNCSLYRSALLFFFATLDHYQCGEGQLIPICLSIIEPLVTAVTRRCWQSTAETKQPCQSRIRILALSVADLSSTIVPRVPKDAAANSCLVCAFLRSRICRSVSHRHGIHSLGSSESTQNTMVFEHVCWSDFLKRSDMVGLGIDQRQNGAVHQWN